MTDSLHVHLALDGTDWTCKPFVGMDWLLRNAHRPDTRDTGGWQRATVPGSVVHDLWITGVIPDPYVDQNSLCCEWVPQRTWLYRKSFAVPDQWRGRRVHLYFEGIDFEAQIFLNGEKLGQHRSMFTPATFEVSSALNYGAENLVVVVIEPAPVEQPQVGYTSQVRTHKSRMTYWWDFCPRMVHLGIWDGVSLRAAGPARLTDVWARPTLNAQRDHAEIAVEITLDAEQPADIDLVLMHNEVEIARQRIPEADAHASAMLGVENPALWWPNGYGAQPLYDLRVTVRDPATGMAWDARTVSIGIRHVEFAPNDTPDATALPYTLCVNGRKIYIKGWNWVPLDVMYGVERPHKLAHLLALAQQANVTLLRVWGGGLIEKEVFYSLCDRLGILVWQEFIQSSSGLDNIPPTDPEFITMLEHEARLIVPRRRNHPSLVIWCGGNELCAGPERPLDEAHPVLAMLRRTVHELDPGRIWLPTTPSGRVFSNSLEQIERDPLAQHDVHGPWEHQGLTAQYTLYNRANSLLHSEFGAEGITNLKTLEATVSAANREPVTLDNPVWFHRGAWWVKQPQWQESLGPVDNLEMLVRGTQFLQAESVRYAVEANRHRKYQNSGSLPWQFNEPYPMAACTSAVDYFGHPKPLYYAVSRAYAPLLVAARFDTMSWAGRVEFEAGLWCANSHAQAQRALLSARLIGPSGDVYAALDQPVTLAANGVTEIAPLRCDLYAAAEVLFLDLRLTDHQGAMLAANRYLFTRQPTLAAALRAAPTSLTCETDRAAELDAWQIVVTNPGEQAALWVWVEDARPRGTAGFVRFSDNYLCLLPGESRTLGAVWDQVAPAERQIAVSGWNTPTMLA